MEYPRTIEWVGDIDGHIRLIDQTLLPTRLEHRECRKVEEIWEAIRSLRVRGAPAIGVAAAMGVVLGMQKQPSCVGRYECAAVEGSLRLPADQPADGSEPVLGAGPDGAACAGPVGDSISGGDRAVLGSWPSSKGVPRVSLSLNRRSTLRAPAGRGAGD